jgi:molybdenum cofactor synthesis domain-containing protein
MRRRLLLTMVGLTVMAVLAVGVPTIVVADPGVQALVLGLGVAVIVVAVAVALVLSGRLMRPLGELAEAADRLRSGDPRPVGRRYGVTELDQVADGLDSAGRRVTSLLAAERELTLDASHQLRTPLTALSMRLEEVIAAADDPDAVRAAFAAARAQADVVISSGGVSVGDADYVRDVFSEFGDIHFWRIDMRPGRPLAFGRLGETWFFGLPGNPVSTAVTFHEFVRPALRLLEGETPAPPLRLQLPLLEPLHKAPRRLDFQRGIVGPGPDGSLGVRSAGPQGSHVMSSLAAANCLIVLPAEVADLPAGATVTVELLPWRGTPGRDAS